MSADEISKLKEQALNYENQKFNENVKIKKLRPEANSDLMAATTWRDLIPVIKLDMCSVIIISHIHFKCLNLIV